MEFEVIKGLPGWPFAIVAALIAILGAFSIQRYIQYRNACNKFREAVAPVLIELRAAGENVYAPYSSTLRSVAVAVEEFRPYAKYPRSFSEAWERYRSQYTAVDAYLSEANGHPKGHAHTDPRPNLERLLHHASH